MKYISKGLVVEGSTEHILKIQRGGYEFQLTGDRARLWLNGLSPSRQNRQEKG